MSKAPLRFTLGRPLERPVQALRGYSFSKLRSDLVAAVTVAVVEVPQAMAYALVAGVPPQYGLYTSVIQGVLGGMFSSSEHLRTGPTNTQSLLIAATVARLVDPGNEAMYLQLVFSLTVIKGVIQLVFSAGKIGNMIRYVSRSVIVGVAAGAGVLIAVGQVPNLLGIELAPRNGDMPGVIGQFQRMWPHLQGINPVAVAVGLGSLGVLLVLKMISRALPGALVVVALSAGLVAVMGWTSADVALIPELTRTLPQFTLPQIEWRLIEPLMAGALALALLGTIESVAIGKSIGMQSDERIDPNQEFFAQGLTNLISGFFQCIPGSGSFSRSALDYEAGGQTRMAAVFNGLAVALIVLILAGAAGYVPLASLSAVLLVIAYRLIDWTYIRKIVRSSRSDTAVCLITIASTLVAPLQYAVFIGIFLNIALYLRQAGKLHMAEMVQTPAGPFLERPIHDRTGAERVVFLQVEGDLFFAVADELHDQLTRQVRRGARVFVLRLKRTHSIDATVLQVLEQFTREVQSRGGHVLLCGIRPELLRILRAYGLYDLIGKENIFETGFGIFASAKRALQRARQLVQFSIDTERIDADLESEALTYEI